MKSSLCNSKTADEFRKFLDEYAESSLTRLMDNGMMDRDQLKVRVQATLALVWIWAYQQELPVPTTLQASFDIHRDATMAHTIPPQSASAVNTIYDALVNEFEQFTAAANS